MKTPFLILLVFVILSHQAISQSISKTLLTKTWYCSCDFATDSLILSLNNSAKFNWEAKFLPNGKLTLRNLKSNTTNTAYFYSVKNQSIRLFYDHKDSLMNLSYTFGKHINKASYKLNLYHGIRYKKQKPSDIPPSDHFTLARNGKRKTFHSLNEITVHRMKKGLLHDSIEYISKGAFLEMRTDTLVMNTYQFSEHNFYKKFPDTLHYFSDYLFDSVIVIKTPVKEITMIYSQRDKLSSIVNATSFVALGTFVVAFPLALTVKNDPLNTIFTRAVVFSALSIPVIISFNIIFSKKKFKIGSGLKKENTWQFENKLPGVSFQK